MNTFRELFFVFAVVAFAMASLIQCGDWFEALFFSFTLLVIATSLLLSIAQTGPKRFFWIGFSVTALGYLIFAQVPDQSRDENSFAFDNNLPHMRYAGPEFTTQLLRFAYMKSRRCELDYLSPQSSDGLFCIQDEGVTSGGAVQGVAATKGQNGTPNKGGLTNAQYDALVDSITKKFAPLPYPGYSGVVVYYGVGNDFPTFMRIGHCCWALLFGWLSGHVCKLIASIASRIENKKPIAVSAMKTA